MFTNPYQEMEDEEKAAEEAARKKAEAEAGINQDAQNRVGKWFSAPEGDNLRQEQRSGVGKYLPAAVLGLGAGAGAAGGSGAQGSGAAAVGTAAGEGGVGGKSDAELMPPPAKKAKPSQGVVFANFDAW